MQTSCILSFVSSVTFLGAVFFSSCSSSVVWGAGSVCPLAKSTLPSENAVKQVSNSMSCNVATDWLRKKDDRGEKDQVFFVSIGKTVSETPVSLAGNMNVL